MELGRITTVVRPRSHWEAVDLGFAMAREFWRPLLGAWLVGVAPVWVIVALALHGAPAWAAFLLWWLRPLFDRVPLFVLSRALFGELPSRRAVLAALPRLYTRHLIPSLFLFRLDPARSFNLPVWQLEELRGTERWRRASVLQRDAHNQAGWLTLICATLELGMDLALLSLASYFIPGKGLPELLSSPFDGAWPLALLLFGFVGFSLVEPFYVAAGFSLYLNRRTHLEGWDVEIAFRRLTDRIRRAARGAALAMTVTLALTALVPSPSASAAPRETPEEAIRAVLKSPEFQTQKKVKTWRLKGLGKESREEEKTSTPRSATVGWIRGVLTVAALVIFLGVFLWRNRGHFETLSASSARAAPLPEPVVGVAPRGERLPSDVPEAALALLVAGRAVDALGLLYRAATILAGRRHAPPEARSWTEGEWIDFVRKSSGVERAHYFGVLVSAWQSAAYAHRAPADAEVRALCAGFGRHFGVA